MTESNFAFHPRSQLAAVAYLRWRMFVNGLRSRRGKMELVSRIIVTGAFAFGGLGGFIGAAGMSWYLVSHNYVEYLAALLWPVFLFWQFFPVMATAFTNNPDSSELLRFPLNYRSFFLIRLAYGLCDPASAVGCAILFGVFLGITVARPALVPVALLALATFALFNLVLMQTVFAWLERWLARRRTREILGMLFILVMLSFQLIGPMTQRMQKRPQPGFRRATETAVRAQGALPPGLAADVIARTARSQYSNGATSFLLLAAITLGIGVLLHLRLRAQFRGENLSETTARPAVAKSQGVQLGWDLPGVSQSVAAVFEKEIRYLFRSGPMLLTLVMPLFMLVVFRLGPMNSMRASSGFLNRTPDMAFPAAACYSLLVLTNLVYNSFGGDSAGIQFFYASPASFSQIVLGKNVAYGSILLANTVIAWFAVSSLYGVPRPPVAIATLTGLLFAAPLNFMAGNLLSIYAPKKRDFATFGRQNASQMTVLASLGIQVVIVGAGAAAFALARLYKNLWIATGLFLVLAAISIPVYVVVLRRIDAIAINRRESLLAELCRA
jgi:ABC-2 type transport system permease protein